MIILIILVWILLIIAIYGTITSWSINLLWENYLNIMGCTLTMAFALVITITGNQFIQEQGIDKYLNKEIVIDKTQITYNAQNNPIDTTYYYARIGN